MLTALRLLTKSEVLQIWGNLFELIDSFLVFAKKYKEIQMPGYTHMQKAMPYTLGAWSEAFISALLDDLFPLQAAFALLNQSPLGSAAAFGTPLPLDRTFSAKLLGFEKVQENTLYCQNSRGKFEGILLASLIAILEDLNKFASDILLFTTSEFNYFIVDKSICTGSSIMPQKKNVDIAELIRSKAHVVLGNYTQIISLSTNLISGYNRDLQDMKKPLLESLEVSNMSIQATTILIKSIVPNKITLRKALTPELYATHKAFALTQQGMPFREAYHEVGKHLDDLELPQEREVLIPLHLTGAKEELQKQKKVFLTFKRKHNAVMTNLLMKGGE